MIYTSLIYDLLFDGCQSDFGEESIYHSLKGGEVSKECRGEGTE